MFRAWQLKEELRGIFKLGPVRCETGDHRLAGVGIEIEARPVRQARPHRPPLPRVDRSNNGMELTNGIAESNNASIGRIRTNARGFHDPKSFITMIMLDRAGLTPQLPWATTT